MKHLNYKILALFMCSLIFLSGCGASGAKSKSTIPFTDMTFSSSADDVIAAEGDQYETYDSIYDGITYTYPKEYMDKAGTIKYMCDEGGALQNIAWTYAGDDGAEVMVLYNNIYAELKNTYGEPTQNADGVNNYAEVWKMDSGNIILSAVLTSDSKMMQVAFLSPAVSK